MITIQNAPPAGPGFFSRLKSRISVLKSPAASASPPREHVAAFGLSSGNAHFRSGLERHDACSESAGFSAYSEQTPLSCHPEERSDEGSAFPAVSAPDSPRLDRSVVIPSGARNPSYAFAARNPEERSREANSPTCAAQAPLSCHPEERSDEGSAFSNVPHSQPAPAANGGAEAPAVATIGPGITLTRIGHTVDWWAPPSWSGRPRRDASSTRKRDKNSGCPDIGRMTSYRYRHWQHAQQSPSHWMP